MSKKIVSMLCLSLCLMLVFSACGSDAVVSNTPSSTTSAVSKNEEPSEGPVEISVIMPVGYKEYFDEVLITKFEETYPGITIKAIYNNEATALLQQQLAAGGGPDIISSQGTTALIDYARTGHIIPIDSYADEYGWRDSFSAWAYPPVSLNGSLYGLPGKLDSEFVYYNKELFAENGFEIPKSYEELEALCEQIQALGIMPFAFGNSDYKYATEWWWSLAFTCGMNPSTLESVLKGDIPWNSPEPTNAMAKMLNLYERGFINDKQSTAMTMDAATQLFSTGKAAMKMEGTWLISNITTIYAPDFDWGVFSMPAWADGVEQTMPFALGVALGINSKCKNPDAAAKFLDIYAQRESQLLGLSYNGMGIPPIDNADLSAIDGIAPQVVEMQNIMNEYTAKGATSYLAWTYWGQQTRVYTCENIDALWLGQIDLETFMDEMQKKAEEDKANGKLFNW